MKGKFIVFLGICLTFTFHSRSNEQGIGYLLEQLSFQMGQRNLFQAEKTLAKLSKVAPNQPVYLQENIRFLIEADRLAEARVQLLKVKRKIPDSDHQALMLLLDIYQNKRKVLSEARLLNKRQLYSQALDKYQSLFAGQPLHYSLALEYWDILTEVKPELEPTVLYKLKRLAKQFPANTRIKLAYYKYSLRAGVNRRDIYDELYLLTFNTVWKFEAKRLWQYGLLNSEVTAANGPLYLAYMQRFPDDNWVSLHYKEGNDAMDKHRTLMRDPAYRAKINLPILVADNADLNKIALTLATARTKYADDQEVLIAQGRFLFRKKDFNGAKKAFTRCLKLFDPSPAVCSSLLSTVDYWHKIAKAEQAIEQQRYSDAQRELEQLYAFDDESNYHIMLDGNLQVLLGQVFDAQKKYAQLVMLEPLNQQYLVTLMTFKLNHFGIQDVDLWLNTLSLQQTQLVLADYHRLYIGQVRSNADTLLSQGKADESEQLLIQGLTKVKRHPWATFDLASLYIQQQKQQQAINLYQPLVDNAEFKYSFSLILARLNLYGQAIEVLNNIAVGDQTLSIKQNIQDYEFEWAMQKIDNAQVERRLDLLLAAEKRFSSNLTYQQRIQQQMLRYGFLAETQRLAQSILDRNAWDNDMTRTGALLQLAEVQLMANEGVKAQNTIELAYQQNNKSADEQQLLAQLSLDLMTKQPLPVELQSQLTGIINGLKQQQPEQVQTWNNRLRYYELTENVNGKWEALTKLVELEPSESYRFYQLFNLYEQSREQLSISDQQFRSEYIVEFIQKFPFDPIGYDAAFRLYQQLPELNETTVSLTRKGYYSALIADISDAANFNGRTVGSKAELLAKSNASDLNPEQKSRISHYVELMDSNATLKHIEPVTGSWLVNRFQSELRQRSIKDNQRLELGIKTYQKSGGQGTSEYDLSVISLTYYAPMDNSWLGDGQWYAKLEPTLIKAGVLDTNEGSSDNFGTIKICDSRCDNLQLDQQEFGTSVALGFDTENVSADIGTKPIGFNLFDWVGGVQYRDSFWDLGWSLGLSKRPVTSSLLSFSGADDPFISTSWGGASLYNFGVSLSYDQGNGWGVWALADAGVILGKEVKQNSRSRAMAGIYMDWFNRDWLTASVGLNVFTWQYQSDLSEFTFGQSGYYSPQQYKSASLPLNFYGRIGDFSYQLDLSVSVSESGDDDIVYYPEHPDFQQALDRLQQGDFSGGKSQGSGFSANAIVEYKLTNHWTLGTTLTIQQSEFFSPNSLFIYLKYYFEPNLQLANRRPKPVTVYMDY